MKFNRVMVNADGLSYSMDRAEEAGVVPTVGFKRADGWSVGAPDELETVAHGLWPKWWTHFTRAPDWKWRPIRELYDQDCDPDPSDAYDKDDPKHPTYRERMLDAADMARKSSREDQ